LGDDTYFVDNPNDQVVEFTGGGTDIAESSVSYTLPDYVEQLVLTGNADINGTGNQLKNTIIGNDGANLIDGGGGVDPMVGAAGKGTYFVNKKADLVVEDPDGGDDTILSAVSYALSANTETLVLTGSKAINGTGNELGNVVIGNDAANALDGSGGADTLI